MSAKDKINILMVDDEPGKLLSYEVMLRELGENLIKANSGREALELLLKDNDVAVVLTDVRMPLMDGFELADIIHQHPRFKQIPIIFISALLVTDLDRLKGYQFGAVDYVSVPIIPELLRAKVSVFAELHRRAQQLETLNGTLRRLSSSLITMQDEERRRIARELHDSLGQELAAAKMAVEGIVLRDYSTDSISKVAADASAIIDRAIQQVRSISHLLHPPLLDEVGLVSALRWYLEGLTKRGTMRTFLDVQPSAFSRLVPELETAIFRIIQEALTNVFRHSGAKNSWITLKQEDSQLVISVRDDGKGINKRVTEFQSGSIGIGIGGMQQRVKEFGGVLRLENTKPGTLVEVTIPSSRLVYPEPTVVSISKQSLINKGADSDQAHLRVTAGPVGNPIVSI